MNADQITQAVANLIKLLDSDKITQEVVDTINMTLIELLIIYPTVDPLNEVVVKALLK